MTPADLGSFLNSAHLASCGKFKQEPKFAAVKGDPLKTNAFSIPNKKSCTNVKAAKIKDILFVFFKVIFANCHNNPYLDTLIRLPTLIIFLLYV